MEELRVSVRELVEFTLHGADIRLISGRMQDMLDGTLGHQARQKLLGDGWQAEVPLNLPIPVEDEEMTLVLGGRMDAFRDATDVPCVEEIKLWQGEHPPEAPIPAHRMQAVCYGHMLCVTRGLPAVDVRVVYVTRRGRCRANFRNGWRRKNAGRNSSRCCCRICGGFGRFGGTRGRGTRRSPR